MYAGKSRPDRVEEESGGAAKPNLSMPLFALGP